MGTAFSQLSPMQATLGAMATIACFAISSLFLRFLWKTYQLRGIPGPKASSLFLGHLLDTLGRVANWHEAGDYPEPFLSWLHDHFHRPESYPACARDKVLEIFLADITLGAGLLSTSGTTHDKYRKMLNPLFTPNQIKQFVPIYESQARRVCDTVLAPAAKSGKAIDLADVFSDLTLRVIGLAGFGFDFESNPEAHLAYLDGHLEITPLILIGSYLIPNFLSYPLPSLLHRRKAQAKIRKVVNDVIEHKLASKQDPNRPKDLLDLFLPHSSTTEAIFHTMTFLQAGHETTCSALSWIFAALITYPDAAAKVRQEYKETVAKYGSLDSWEAVSSLKYTLAVIQETMRLNVVVYMVVRRTFMQDDYVPMQEGPSVFVPAGTTIEVNIAALNRHPKYWAQADTFIPERFLEGTSEWDVDLKLRDGKSHAFYYVPFSAGSKNCIGQRFALVEMQVTVATLFGRFGFALTGDANLGAKYNGTVLFPAKLEVIVQSIDGYEMPWLFEWITQRRQRLPRSENRQDSSRLEVESFGLSTFLSAASLC
ncbi:hypothetical protein Ae201684_012667 [Aphanomyces euteiches]|uniref:Cytochrome P450 n=1 Tax=Aphanomyces euteiches TaxID=100861 RepID=A0A6G0WQR3_9STRA|nr:hypothetical protein Ae201684_012667 [Aphanomyces euteiches]